MATIMNTHLTDETARARAAATHIATTWHADVSEHDVEFEPATGHALVGFSTVDQLVLTVVATNDHGTTELSVDVVELADIVGAYQGLDCRWYVTTVDGRTMRVPRRLGAATGARTHQLATAA